MTTAPFTLGILSAPGGPPFPALLVGDEVVDLRSRWRDTAAILDDWSTALPALRTLAAAGDRQPLAGFTVHAPVAPRQVLQAGANYRTHVIDLAVKHGGDRDEAAAMMDRRIATGEPYFFIGLPTVITGPYDDVVLPAYSEQHDWELELAAVIGRGGYGIDPADALDHVAGYTIVNDLTTRDLVFRRDMPEIGSDWFRAKNAPGFLPTGPWLVPAEFVPDHPQITLRLNGDVMQDESTKDMIFDVATLVSVASRTVPLQPGDLILTGSPAGNGLHHGRLLRAGDVMEGTITALGTQRTRCVAP